MKEMKEMKEMKDEKFMYISIYINIIKWENGMIQLRKCLHLYSEI